MSLRLSVVETLILKCSLRKNHCIIVISIDDLSVALKTRILCKQKGKELRWKVKFYYLNSQAHKDHDVLAPLATP